MSTRSSLGRTKLLALVIVLLLFTYTWAWKDGYDRSHRFYGQATANLEAGRLDLALKGSPPVSSARALVGGFQQAMDVWRHPLAWPKPAIYDQSAQKVNELIANLDPDQAFEIFSIYFQQDNRLLPAILLQMGQALETEGDYREAKEAYLMLIDAFGRSAPEQVLIAKERLQILESR